MVLEKTLESPLGCKETNQMRKAKPVYSVLAIARKSVTITRILVNREAGSRLENLYSR